LYCTATAGALNQGSVPVWFHSLKWTKEQERLRSTACESYFWEVRLGLQWSFLEAKVSGRLG
jgi:hypothetical protein